MANYFDNSQFSCRFGDAAPFKATTRGSDGTTMQWTQMGLPHRHPKKSKIFREILPKCFLGQIIFPFISKGQRQTQCDLETSSFKRGFLLFRGRGRSGACLEFYKPEKFTCENSGNGSITAGRKKKILVRCVCLPVSCAWCWES